MILGLTCCRNNCICSCFCDSLEAQSRFNWISGFANLSGYCRSIAQAVPCHPGSPASMRLSRVSFRAATALFIAPENSGIFRHCVNVSSSIPTTAAASSSVSPKLIASAIRAVISGVRFVGRPPGCLALASPLEETLSGIFLPGAKFNLSFRVVLLNLEALTCLLLPSTVTGPPLELETLMFEKGETTVPVCAVETGMGEFAEAGFKCDAFAMQDSDVLISD